MSETHKVTITFLMEEMTGTPEESAEVLLDVYIPEECECHVDNAWKVAVSETHRESLGTDCPCDICVEMADVHNAAMKETGNE